MVIQHISGVEQAITIPATFLCFSVPGPVNHLGILLDNGSFPNIKSIRGRIPPALDIE